MTGRSVAMLPLVAAAAAMLGTPAVAAPPRAKPNQRQVGDATASCVVGAEAGRVRALLATLPGSPAELRAARRLEPTFAACSEGAFRITAGRKGSGLYNGRADLAAAMVAAMPTPRTPDAKGEAWYVAALKAAPANGYDGVLIGIQEFGACVVAADGADAVRLVRSAARSPEEGAALAGLAPVLSPCIARGARLNFTRDELRLVVAEPLYHAMSGAPAPMIAR